jgi:hypothetical protein
MCVVFSSGTDLVDDEIARVGGHRKVAAEAFGRMTGE